jgi:hypothetical protein
LAGRTHLNSFRNPLNKVINAEPLRSFRLVKLSFKEIIVIVVIFLFWFFFLCEFVDNVNTDRGELDEGKGVETYFVIQSPASFLNKHQIEIKALRPIIKVLIVFRSVNG